MNKKRRPTIAFWEKDGRWHITKRYEPTESDRKQFPLSYPPGNSGPFYVWSDDSFDTKEAAAAALQV